LLGKNKSLYNPILFEFFFRSSSFRNYIVFKGVYHILSQEEQHVCTPFMKLIWNKVMSLKVSLFAWRIMNKRLSTKDYLVRRKVFCYDSLACPSACGKEKTINHLFFNVISSKVFDLRCCSGWKFCVSSRCCFMWFFVFVFWFVNLLILLIPF